MFDRDPLRPSGELVALTVVVLLTAVASPAQAQKETERFIPIGQSPGLSLVQTYIGPILEIDPRLRTITVGDSAARYTVKIAGETRIWLDRNKLKQMNLTGSFVDLQPGRRIEIKFVDPAKKDVADWVKVEIT